MSKDLEDEQQYTTRKGKIPFRWTAPEVGDLVVRGALGGWSDCQGSIKGSGLVVRGALRGVVWLSGEH